MTFSSITVALLAGTIILVPTSAYSDVYYARTKELWVQGDQIQIEFGTVNECPIVFMALYRYDEFVKLYSFPTSIGLTLTLDSANLEASDGYHAFLWCNTIKEGTTVSFRLVYPTFFDPVTNLSLGLTYYYTTPNGCQKIKDGVSMPCENLIPISQTHRVDLVENLNLSADVQNEVFVTNIHKSNTNFIYVGFLILIFAALSVYFLMKKLREIHL